MRKASIRHNHEQFESNLQALESIVDRLSAKSVGLNAAERDILLEAFALQLASCWEELVVEDFVDALNRDTTQYAKHVGITLPKDLSRDICFGLLVGDRYLDFRSIGDLIGHSKELLVAMYNPFIHIPARLRQRIDDFSILRNYLAHRSRRAERSYSKMIRDKRYNYTYIVRPGSFLRGIHENTGRRRFLFFLDGFRDASVAVRGNAHF